MLDQNDIQQIREVIIQETGALRQDFKGDIASLRQDFKEENSIILNELRFINQEIKTLTKHTDQSIDALTTHVDSFIKLHKDLYQELTMLRARVDRLEETVRQLQLRTT